MDGHDVSRSGEDGLRLRSPSGSGGFLVFEVEWVQRHMAELAVLFNPEDVRAVTIHRDSGDFRYERVPDDE